MPTLRHPIVAQSRQSRPQLRFHRKFSSPFPRWNVAIRMARTKCNACGKAAFAYMVESDGARLYLCLDHFPASDAHHDYAPRPRLAKPDRPPPEDES